MAKLLRSLAKVNALSFMLPLALLSAAGSASRVSTTSCQSWPAICASHLITNALEGSNRLSAASIALEALGIQDNTVVNRFAMDREDKVRGCYTSHVATLRNACATMKRQKIDKFNLLMLEDNFEVVQPSSVAHDLIQEVNTFAAAEGNSFDVIHLGYMMYVPGLRIQRSPNLGSNIVQLLASSNATAVGTSGYIISDSGAEKLLAYDQRNGGYAGVPLPNVFATLYPSTRYAVFPMLVHRSGSSVL